MSSVPAVSDRRFGSQDAHRPSEDLTARAERHGIGGDVFSLSGGLDECVSVQYASEC